MWLSKKNQFKVAANLIITITKISGKFGVESLEHAMHELLFKFLPLTLYHLDFSHRIFRSMQ